MKRKDAVLCCWKLEGTTVSRQSKLMGRLRRQTIGPVSYSSRLLHWVRRKPRL